MQSAQPSSRGLLEDPQQKPTRQLDALPVLSSLPSLLAAGWGIALRVLPPKLHLVKHLELVLQHQENVFGLTDETSEL